MFGEEFLKRTIYQNGTLTGTEVVPAEATSVRIICLGAGGKESYNITGVEPVFYANGGRGGYAMCTLDVEEGDEFLFKVGDHSLVGPCGGGEGRITSEYKCGDGGGASIVAKRLTNDTSTVVCIAGGGGGAGGPTGDGGVGNSANASSTYSFYNGEDGIGGSSSGTPSGEDMPLENGYNLELGNGGNGGLGGGGGGYGGGAGVGGAGGSYGDFIKERDLAEIRKYNISENTSKSGEIGAIVFEYYKAVRREISTLHRTYVSGSGLEVVPESAVEVKICCFGSGGTSCTNVDLQIQHGFGGFGGYSEITLNVEPGEEFFYKVGDHSQDGPCSGGLGGTVNVGGNDVVGGTGGGGSLVAKRIIYDVYFLVCLAGGGGGGGRDGNGAAGIGIAGGVGGGNAGLNGNGGTSKMDGDTGEDFPTESMYTLVSGRGGDAKQDAIAGGGGGGFGGGGGGDTYFGGGGGGSYGSLEFIKPRDQAEIDKYSLPPDTSLSDEIGAVVFEYKLLGPLVPAPPTPISPYGYLVERRIFQNEERRGLIIAPEYSNNVKITCFGSGGKSHGDAKGGEGGFAETYISCSPGDTFLFRVGDLTPYGGGPCEGGYASISSEDRRGGGGSVVAKVTSSGNEVLCVAGGGGGASTSGFGSSLNLYNGGHGGYDESGRGQNGDGEDEKFGKGGGLGFGGDGGTYSPGDPGETGGDMVVENGFTYNAGKGGNVTIYYGGAGGGGYGGGGGAGENAGSGGGGGSYGGITKPRDQGEIDKYEIDEDTSLSDFMGAVVFDFFSDDTIPEKPVSSDETEEEKNVVEETEEEPTLTELPVTETSIFRKWWVYAGIGGVLVIVIVVIMMLIR